MKDWTMILGSRRSLVLFFILISALMVMLSLWHQKERASLEEEYNSDLEEYAYRWYQSFSAPFLAMVDLMSLPGNLAGDEAGKGELLDQRLQLWRRAADPDLLKDLYRYRSSPEGENTSEVLRDGVFEKSAPPEAFTKEILGGRRWDDWGEWGGFTFVFDDSRLYQICASWRDEEFYILEYDWDIFKASFLKRISNRVFQGRGNRLGDPFLRMEPAVIVWEPRGEQNYRKVFSLGQRGIEEKAELMIPLSSFSFLEEEAKQPSKGQWEDSLEALQIWDAPFLWAWLNSYEDSLETLDDQEDWERLIEPGQEILFFAYLPTGLSVRQIVFFKTLPFLLIAYLSLLVLGAALLLLSRYTRESRGLLIRQEEFVSSLTHELRTPLHIISNGADNLADGIVSDPESTARYGKLIRRESDRLSTMIESILSYSGVSRRELEFRPLELDELLDEILSPYRLLCREQGIRLEEELEKGIVIQGDREAFRMILSNLLSNALRYGRDGGRIVVGLSVGRSLQIRVQDWGKGIPRHELDKITRPFYRGKGAEDETGNGLGLSIVARTVKASGGKLKIESEGEGALFRVELPMAVEKKGDE